jgi:hypothetical protein
MESVVGVFALRADGERAVRDLLAAGFSPDRVTLLTPHASDAQVQSVPTTEAEPPGIGRAIGAVAGAAAGAGGGMQAAALLTLAVPGVGPVLALGALGAVLFGIGGAAVGAAIDRNLREGLPRDELYVYEDALRRGKTVVIGLAESAEQAERARGLLTSAGAESIDAAREQWWVGLRDAERAEYTQAGGDFVRDEAIYRRGFETACALGPHASPYTEVIGELRVRCPDVYEHESFRQGFARGRAYVRGGESRRAA